MGLVAASVLFQTVPDFKKAVNYLFLSLGILGCVGVLILLTVESVPAGGAAGSGDEDEEGEEAGSHASLTQHDHGSGAHARKVSDDHEGAGKAQPPPTLYETLRLVYASRSMQLLVPIIFYCGASLGFHFANFPLLYQGACPSVPTVLPRVQLTGHSYIRKVIIKGF